VAGESSASDGGLRAANARLRPVIARQAGELATTRAQIAALLERAGEQERRIEELTAQVDELSRRLGRNSKNSLMPPSAEGLAKNRPCRVSGAAAAGQAAWLGRPPSGPGRHS
jgi:hypothetical protein